MTTEPQRALDGYGSEEMAIPEWKLVQKVGGDWAKGLGAKPGQFHNNITDEIADELNIVVVDIKMGRSKWGAEITDSGPACASMDAKGNASIYGDDCAQCPDRVDAPWSLDATKRRTKCCINYTILGIDLDHDYLPVMVRAHGISALPARQLITQLKTSRALRGEYYKAIVNIKSQAKDTRYGITYAVHPKVTGLIEDKSKAEELKAESNRLLGMPIPLPEGRPDEETEPLGFTPEGTPFYNEEERQKLMAPQVQTQPKVTGKPAQMKEPAPAPTKQPLLPKTTAQKTEPAKKPPAPTGPIDLSEPVDLDF